MVTPEFVQCFAEYNHWQNQNQYQSSDLLSDAVRRRDRGSFFGSIHGTLSHLLWADTLWMSRFDDWERPQIGIPDSPGLISDWSEMCARRNSADEAILKWAYGLNGDDLLGDLSWYSGALGRAISRPRAVCITHFFNHQTHHLGQVHAMLTAAGAIPGETDLFTMPSLT